jgi:hypothetical protein
MVINIASKICAMIKEHAVLMLPIATSEAHVGLMGRRHCKYRITVNVSYISYKHYFNLSCNCVILSTNKGVNYTSLLFFHGPSKAFLAQTMIFKTLSLHITLHIYILVAYCGLFVFNPVTDANRIQNFRGE